ncbi:hypothetical protein GCM10010987_80000 [Bradyrhizobium guangdongense]|uniref:Uncharacterized protein n=1 Tax=Bradyrhizobium guangdongense TaxID=1325090 RepID=A0AA87WCE5_9BRAD|nr:hypothetical protein GCM10010987_80000 [Bradyrhizobium guangdongense]
MIFPYLELLSPRAISFAQQLPSPIRTLALNLKHPHGGPLLVGFTDTNLSMVVMADAKDLGAPATAIGAPINS